MLLLIALVCCSTALLLVVSVMVRVFRNVGPLDLEDYARRNHVVYLPVSEALVAQLQSWSKPVRMRLDTHRHHLLAELVVTSTLSDAEGFDAAGLTTIGPD